MIDKLTMPAEYLDKSHYFKTISKEYKIPLDIIWALYNSDITNEDFKKLLREMSDKQYYKK